MSNGGYMDTTRFQNILQDMSDLTYAQLKKLRHESDRLISENLVGQVIAEREEVVADCPHCHSEEKNRWGVTKQGIQRFKCKSCGKTYNALAGTALHRMRKPEQWIKYNQMMWDGVSTRTAAKRLGINLKTSFRWRHAFLDAPTKMPVSEISGVIEVDETFIRESKKGQRVIDRPSRKRGKSTMYKSGKIKKVPIVIAMNRDGLIAHQVLERKSKKELQDFVKPLLTSGSVLCTDGNPSYVGVTEGLNVDHKILNASKREHVKEGIYHIQTLNNYMMNFNNWMSKFRGVATTYLPKYLSWYRFMKQNKSSDQVWLRFAL